MNRLLAAAVLFVSATGYAAPDAFDTGFDVKAALAEVHAEAPVRTSAARYTSDCANVTIRGDETESPSVTLRTQEWVEECHYVPGDPRHGGGGQNCWTRPGNTWKQTARVKVSERKALYPWESDTFQVCLEGPWLDARPLATAYDYTYDRHAGAYGELVFVPGGKKRMKPDAGGIVIEGLSPALVLSLRDKWASYYAGEKTTLKLEVKEDVPNWFDPTVAEISGEIAGGGDRITVDVASGLAGKLKAGKKYYVKVSFQRIGSISKDDEVSAGETSPTEYRPAAFASL